VTCPKSTGLGKTGTLTGSSNNRSHLLFIPISPSGCNQRQTRAFYRKTEWEKEREGNEEKGSMTDVLLGNESNRSQSSQMFLRWQQRSQVTLPPGLQVFAILSTDHHVREINAPKNT
jgi:hypothetical protein